jgi:N-succinyldiaminopimelate aminotransferase
MDETIDRRPRALNSRVAELAGNPFDLLNEFLDGIRPSVSQPIIASLGDPHSDCPVPISVMADCGNLWRRYPPLRGTEALRTAIFGWLERRFGLKGMWTRNELDVLPTAGTREALFLAATLCVPPARKGSRTAVLLPNPCYPGYFGAAVISGAEPILLPSTRRGGFLPDLAAVGVDVLNRTAALYLTNPSNPEGAAASNDYLGNVLELSERYGFVLIVDECCIDLYLRSRPTGVLEVCQRRRFPTDNLLVFNSLSKRSYAAGLRSGFVAGGKFLIEQMRVLRSYAGATIPLPIQAASAALWRDDVHVAAIRDDLTVKFDLAEQMLGGRFRFYRPDAGFFLWLDVGDDRNVTRRLWSEGLKVMPGSFLGRWDGRQNPGTGYVRVALLHDLQRTREMLERLQNLAGA